MGLFASGWGPEACFSVLDNETLGLKMVEVLIPEQMLG